MHEHCTIFVYYCSPAAYYWASKIFVFRLMFDYFVGVFCCREIASKWQREDLQSADCGYCTVGKGEGYSSEEGEGGEDKRCTLSEWGPVVLHGSDARPYLSACFLFNLWAVGVISWLQISLREGQTQQQLLSFPSYLYSGHNRFPVMGSLCRTVLPAPTWYRGKHQGYTA